MSRSSIDIEQPHWLNTSPGSPPCLLDQLKLLEILNKRRGVAMGG